MSINSLSPIAFKSSMLNQLQQKSITANVEKKNDSIESTNTKQKNTLSKKTAVTAAAAAVLLLALVLRKKITTGIKKLLNKDASKTAEDLSNNIKKGTETVKLPKPKFGTNATAEEKAAYINSIWDEFIYVNPPYKPVDKKKNIQGLKALQKYGTVEDLRKLPSDYKFSQDSEIMKEYAKLVGIVGEVRDSITLMAKLNKDYIKIYSEETMAEIMKSLKKLMVDKAAPKTWINFDYGKYLEFEKMSKSKNPEISENAKAIMDRIALDSPWVKE